jgi:hypothetical protein
MHEICINGDFYVKFTSYEEFDQWCQEGFWEGAKGFEEKTGVSYYEIKDKYFQVIHNRVYLYEEA